MHHTEAVKREWLDKTPSSGTGSLERKDLAPEKGSDEFTLNYNTVYGAMNKPRKRPIILKEQSLDQQGKLSTFLNTGRDTPP